MAILKIQLLTNNGTILRDFTTAGNLNFYKSVVKEAISSSLEESIGTSTSTVAEASDEEDNCKDISKIIDEQLSEGSGYKDSIKLTVKPKEVEKEETKCSSTLPKKLKTIRDAKAFTVYNCPHCGRTLYGVHYANDTVVCGCGNESKVPSDLVLAQYSCPNCNSKAFAYVQYTDRVEDIPYIKCRHCESPIDLFFNEKLGQYVSANR